MTKTKKTEEELVNSELEHLRSSNINSVLCYDKTMLRSSINRNKLLLMPTLQIIKYIDPSLKHTSPAPRVYIEWLVKKDVMSLEKKERALLKVKDEELEVYKKYPSALEIRVRYKHRNKSKEYQDLKVAIEYNKWLYKYLKTKQEKIKNNSELERGC